MVRQTVEETSHKYLNREEKIVTYNLKSHFF